MIIRKIKETVFTKKNDLNYDVTINNYFGVHKNVKKKRRKKKNFPQDEFGSMKNPKATETHPFRRNSQKISNQNCTRIFTLVF